MSIFTDFDWVEKMKEEVGEMAEIIETQPEQTEAKKVIAQVRNLILEMEVQVQIGNQIHEDKKQILKLLNSI
jgi:oligoribonuclease (3'-5' exoribonuclease)